MKKDRQECHDLIRKIPKEGLAEALSVLRDMYAFYTQPPPPAQFSLKGHGHGKEKSVKCVARVSNHCAIGLMVNGGTPCKIRVGKQGVLHR